MQWIPGQPGINSETLSSKHKPGTRPRVWTRAVCPSWGSWWWDMRFPTSWQVLVLLTWAQLPRLFVQLMLANTSVSWFSVKLFSSIISLGMFAFFWSPSSLKSLSLPLANSSAAYLEPLEWQLCHHSCGQGLLLYCDFCFFGCFLSWSIHVQCQVGLWLGEK